MKSPRLWLYASLIGVVVLLLTASVSTVKAEPTLTDKEALGKLLFFDQNLSIHENQSCAACHGPTAGWTGPEKEFNAHGAVYEGSISGKFGARKPPSSAYATQSPIFRRDKKGQFIGGNFWDGRATGEILGNPAADQAQASPFTNPVEQALPNFQAVVEKVCGADYADLFKQVWGNDICALANVEMAWDSIALSIADYEASSEVNAFTAKYDYALRGQAKLTKQEQRGFALFKGKGKCAACHLASDGGALFTDYTYDNLGIPKNPENPVYYPQFGNQPNFVDPGLSGFLATQPQYAQYAAANEGKFKVPTLRNVAKGACEAEPNNPHCITKAYGHNGYFKTLKGIVHFYNTRDVLPRCPTSADPTKGYTEAQALAARCWPAPEVAQNLNMAELGNLGLTAGEEAALVAFLGTLSDGYVPMAVTSNNVEDEETLQTYEIFLPMINGSAK